MGESSGHWLARAQDGVTIFLGVVIEAAPFLVLGVLVSQVLALAVRRDWLVGWLPRGRLTSLTALAGLGAAFPVCECGNVPVARRLIGRGVPVAAALVFLLSAPALNPVVALSTFAAFRDRPSIVVLRLSLTLAVAVGIGLLFSFHPRPAAMLRRGGAPLMPEAAEDRPVPAGRARRFAGGVLEEFVEMGAVLVVGAALAALTQVLVPRATLLGIGQGPVLSVAVMMTLALILSVCSTVDAFVALAYGGTFTDGSLIAFLVFGPMIDIKSILLMLTVFSARTVALVTVLVSEAVLLIGIALNYWTG
jgi:uncharacterized membrane protein YraQ (UPF0718 family)